MPSGRTHDAITLMLAAPAAAVGYVSTGSLISAILVGSAFVFGGMMFGPDLDTISRQYSRWWAFRFLWLPYRSFFKHRSRLSHGLIFGALIRVIYFLGILTLSAFVAVYLYSASASGTLPDIVEFTDAWRPVGSLIRNIFGDNFLVLIFTGLWFGAASHTFTDMAGSFVKTGRITKFL